MKEDSPMLKDVTFWCIVYKPNPSVSIKNNNNAKTYYI